MPYKWNSKLLKKKTMPDQISPELKSKIEDLLQNNDTVLFMKGDKYLPKCGFSAQVVKVLKTLEVDFISYDILLDEDLRQALKIYSSWPTYPQLYVNGELVGGCDIITEMYLEGELEKLWN